jgi:hypothetical protein
MRTPFRFTAPTRCGTANLIAGERAIAVSQILGESDRKGVQARYVDPPGIASSPAAFMGGSVLLNDLD